MPDDLKKISSLLFADQTSQESVSEDDVQLVKAYLEKQLGSEIFPICTIDGITTLVSEEGEFVAEILPDGTVCMLNEDREFHVDDLKEEEEEDIWQDWDSFWESWFQEKKGPEGSIWNSETTAPTQNSAAKFSSPQQYTEPHAFEPEVSEANVPEIKISTDDAEQKVANDAEESYAINIVDVVYSFADDIVHESSEVILNSSNPLVEESIPHFSASDMDRSVVAFAASEQKPATESTRTEEVKSANHRSIAGASDVICAEGEMVVVDREATEQKPLFEKQAQETVATNSSKHSMKKPDSGKLQSTDQDSRQVLSQEDGRSDGTVSTNAHKKSAPQQVLITPSIKKGNGPSSFHNAGSQAFDLNSDPFAIACEQASRGGLPPLSHDFAPALAMASIVNRASNETIEPAHQRDGHHERQDRNGKNEDQGSERDDPEDNDDFATA